jgi:hypothetical protein
VRTKAQKMAGKKQRKIPRVTLSVKKLTWEKRREGKIRINWFEIFWQTISEVLKKAIALQGKCINMLFSGVCFVNKKLHLIN